jgi:hypothetical protein
VARSEANHSCDGVVSSSNRSMPNDSSKLGSKQMSLRHVILEKGKTRFYTLCASPYCWDSFAAVRSRSDSTIDAMIESSRSQATSGRDGTAQLDNRASCPASFAERLSHCAQRESVCGTAAAASPRNDSHPQHLKPPFWLIASFVCKRETRSGFDFSAFFRS